MSFKDHLMKHLDMSDGRFDEFAELACRIEDGGVPICKELRDSKWFELLAAYGTANRERRKDIYD